MPKKCTICGKPLAEANKENICFCHQVGMIIHEHTPVTGCTSWKPALESGANAPSEVPSPGDDGYNDMAFDKSVAGAIDEDGSVYEVDLGDLPPITKEFYEADTIINEINL